MLNCSNLAGVTKVFVLNHCRGFQNFQLAQKVYIEGNNSLIGSEENSGHLLDDCLFYYSTAHGNPAVRNTNGSVYFKAYFKINVYFTFLFVSIWNTLVRWTVFWNIKKQFGIALNNLDEHEDSNDLNLKIKAFFKTKTFESQIVGTNQQFFISPYIESHLNLKLYFPPKQV